MCSRPDQQEIPEFISYKLTGILFTGVSPIPCFCHNSEASPSGIGLVTGRTFHFWYLLIILVLITAFVSFRSHKARKGSAKITRAKLNDWFPRHVILSVQCLACSISLDTSFCSGEYSGFYASEAFGFWPALIINILLYSLVHLPQGKILA